MSRLYTIHQGDALAVLKTLTEASVQCCVTSPPYWGLRDYGAAGQMGFEPTIREYVSSLVSLFREVRRVLKDDGVLWLNLGDSYIGSAGGKQGKNGQRATRTFTARSMHKKCSSLKPKDLVGIPWRVAFALQDDGWWLRSDCIWAKPNPMPESVRDRPTKSHEYVFLLTKSLRYFWNEDGAKEDGVYPAGTKAAKGSEERFAEPGVNARPPEYKIYDGKRNIRTVWNIATRPTHDAHFAVFPEEIPERCIKAATRPRDLVLDPFTGSGTTGRVALRLGREFVGIELNPEYITLAHERIREVETGVSRRESKEGQRGLFV